MRIVVLPGDGIGTAATDQAIVDILRSDVAAVSAAQ
jgi:isocitrate/isopropylmalate dehydrogenase